MFSVLLETTAILYRQFSLWSVPKLVMESCDQSNRWVITTIAIRVLGIENLSLSCTVTHWRVTAHLKLTVPQLLYLWNEEDSVSLVLKLHGKVCEHTVQSGSLIPYLVCLLVIVYITKPHSGWIFVKQAQLWKCPVHILFC